MKKMKTLFKRHYTGEHEFILLDEVSEGCEWVLNGEGIATRKIDGTACMVKDGKFYVRYDTWKGNEGIPKRKLKAGKKARQMPVGSIICQELPNPTTGSFPVWAPIERLNADTFKHYTLAFDKYKEELEDGTYELCGPHFNGNPEHLEEDKFIKHGSVVLENVPRNYAGIKQFLEDNYIEGIVFHRENGDMCKIKRTDFNFEWNGCTQKRN